MEKPCLICYKLTTPADSETSTSYKGTRVDDDVSTMKGRMREFFYSLQEYLNGNNTFAETGAQAAMQVSIDKVISSGLHCCDNCLKVVGPFCQLYQQLKSIQLLLDEKLVTLKDIMSSAQKATGRLKKFRCCARQLETDDDVVADETIDFILKFNKDLVNQCIRKFRRTTTPKVKVLLNEHQTKEVAPFPMSPSFESVILPLYSTLTKSEPNPLENLEDPPTSSRLRVSYRCILCLKTFSTPRKLEEHQNSHENLTNWNSEEDEDTYVKIEATDTNWRVELEDDNGAGDTDFIDESVGEIWENPTLDNDSSPRIFDANLEDAYTLTKITDKEAAETWPPSPTAVVPYSEASGRPKSIFNPETDKHKCSKCPKEFMQRKHFVRHYKSVHLKVRYMCPLCGKDFSQRGSYNTHHQNIHRSDKGVKYKCNLCPSVFDHVSLFRHHYNNSHVKEKFKCEYCNKEFFHQESLKRHFYDTHQRGKTFKCPICNKSFLRQYHLSRHEKTNCAHKKPVHMQNEKFACDLCEEGFKFKRELVEHRKEAHLEKN